MPEHAIYRTDHRCRCECSVRASEVGVGLSMQARAVLVDGGNDLVVSLDVAWSRRKLIMYGCMPLAADQAHILFSTHSEHIDLWRQPVSGRAPAFTGISASAGWLKA